MQNKTFNDFLDYVARLRGWKHFVDLTFGGPSISEVKDVMTEAAQLYADYCVEKSKEWVSVETILPEKGKKVNCKLSENIGIGTVEKILYRMKHNGKWNDYNHLVTHWQPLPKAPKP